MSDEDARAFAGFAAGVGLATGLLVPLLAPDWFAYIVGVWAIYLMWDGTRRPPREGDDA